MGGVVMVHACPHGQRCPGPLCAACSAGKASCAGDTPKHPFVALRELLAQREGQSDLAAVPVELGVLRRLLARVDLPPERQPGRIAWNEALAVAWALVEERRVSATLERPAAAAPSQVAAILVPLEDRLKRVAEDDRCARCGLGFLVADRTGGVTGSVRVKVGESVYHGGCADAQGVDGEWT